MENGECFQVDLGSMEHPSNNNYPTCFSVQVVQEVSRDSRLACVRERCDVSDSAGAVFDGWRWQMRVPFQREIA